MGVFVLNQQVDIAAIAAEMRTAVARWFNAVIEIIDPNTGEANDFNRTANTSTNGETILWTGSAQVRTIRRPENMRTEYSKTDLRSIIIQLPLDLTFGEHSDGTIRKGLRVRITDGGEDTTMQNYVYVVRSGVGSSGMWTRTIICDVDLGALTT